MIFSRSGWAYAGTESAPELNGLVESPLLVEGGAHPTPVVREGEITVRNIMNVTMSCDHRVIDGATGAKFLQTFKQMLEQPGMMSA